MSFALDSGVDPQQQRARGIQSNIPGKRATSRCSLPSPSSSHSAPEERNESFKPGRAKLRRKSASAPATPISEAVSGCCRPQGQKRKRNVHEQDSSDCPRKRQAPEAKSTTSLVSQIDGSESAGALVKTQLDPIGHWAVTQEWPENFASMSRDRSSSPRKRPASLSYSQSVRAGEAPRAHSAAHERKLTEHGLYMDEMQGRSLVKASSKELCREFLKGTYLDPVHTMFPLSEFLSVWQRVQNRNEARVFRDLTPLLVPSPELLYINGHPELEHVLEDINTEWLRCKTLGGPRPKPDFAVGISPSAFDEKELAKLRSHTAFEHTTMVTDNLYFPFIMCEAKCGDQAISGADRQNMHSCSIAVDAIIRLYRSWDAHKAAELSGQILVFSISHDNVLVKIYGHFAIIAGEKLSFYRYPIASFTLNFEEIQGRKRTHDFVREVYKVFYPTHLQRIRDALVTMDDPNEMSIVSTTTTADEVPENSELDAQSSQEATSSFKVPGIPASTQQKDGLALLQGQLAEQQRQSALLKRQLEQQRQDAERRLEQADLQRKELMELLKQRVEPLSQLLQKD